MPAVLVETTIELRNPARIAQDLSALVAAGLHKPEKYVTVSIRKSLAMTRGGNPSDCVFVEVRSIGAINKDVNAALSKQICELFAKEGVDPEYIDVNFMDVPPQNWGKSTGTF
jgi:phenylpyruvate tautomerase PptA (4-oxalocrotonate tautomerase family)